MNKCLIIILNNNACFGFGLTYHGWMQNSATLCADGENAVGIFNFCSWDIPGKYNMKRSQGQPHRRLFKSSEGLINDSRLWR